MTTPLLCLAAMILIVFLTKIPVAVAMSKAGKGYDNRTPRAQQGTLSGWGARAVAAHQNSFEALTLFTPAVLIAHLAADAGSAQLAANLAVAHTVSRLLYPAAYIADIHIVRSLIWGVGFASSVWLAFLPLVN